MASIAKALKGWASAHTWSLQTMVEGIAHKTGGGIDEHLKNQCALLFVLAQGKPDPDSPGTLVRRRIGSCSTTLCRFARGT